ncbi:MAG: metal ABC transporter ATP-binding protein [Candidatus Zhuqueibacterota bacterium]
MQNENFPIEVHDMTIAYHKKPVLWDVDLTIPEGKLVGIIGPNGAGKSTLIKAILGLIPKASGWVKIYGQPYQDMRLHVGYVPQRESVDWDFPVSVREVVLMGVYGKLGLFRQPTKSHKILADSCLERVGMIEFANRQISQLSGGQQQRVFLARALAQDTRIYLMDEPFAGVDATTEKAIIQLLMDLKMNGKTVLVVHHDLQTVPEYFDWVIMLNMRVVAAGPTAEHFTQENLNKTYGGKLAILSEASEEVARRSGGKL